MASGTAQQFLRYSFLKPTTTDGSFTINKNGTTVKTSNQQINSTADISILPGDIMTVTINPTITLLTSNIFLIENGVITQQIVNTGQTTCTFNVLSNTRYEITSYLDFIPVAPVVRYLFNTNNRTGTFRVFRNNTQILQTNSLVNNYVNIPGLSIGDSIITRVEPSYNTTSSLSVNNTSLVPSLQLYGKSSNAGIVNQSNAFILQSGGVYEVTATLSPPPIIIYYRHDSNMTFSITRNGNTIYTPFFSTTTQLEYRALTSITFAPGDVRTAFACTDTSGVLQEATIEFFEGNTSNIIGGMSTLFTCIAPDFTVQAGAYFISAYKPSTVFTSTPI